MTGGNLQSDFWRGKRVLITGHSGFKGSWLTIWLQRMGAQVTGLSLPPATQPNLFELSELGRATPSYWVDIRNAQAVLQVVAKVQPEVVFHLAAQALVRPSYADPLTTFNVNVLGTAHVLDSLRQVSSVRSVVAVTTDKVYKNLEQPLPYRENDALGGHDPYSASKAASELVIACYRDAFLQSQGVALSSARAGNVIGGGDWSVDRLIPDAIRAWQAQQPLLIRRPDAIRPWQYVLEPLAGYLQLAQRQWEKPQLADAYNFGPRTHEAATVRQVVHLAAQAYGHGQVVWDDETEGVHEAGWLSLEVAKSRVCLDVVPRWDLAETVIRTVDWYRNLERGESALALCLRDIDAFEASRPI